MDLPPDVEQSLKAEIRKAYASAVNIVTQISPDRHIDDAQHLILGVVHRTLQDRARTHNASAPAAACMPNELLAEVFLSLPFTDRIATSHVCHAWRTASLESSHLLWSVIEESKRPHVFAALLERSGQALISIPNLIVERYTQSDFARHVGSHMHRIRELHVEFVLREEVLWNAWQTILDTPAPHIRELGLTIKDSEASLIPFPPQLFGGYAPSLRALRLWNCTVNFDSVDLSTLEHVSISRDIIFVKDVLKILKGGTRLRTMRIIALKRVDSRETDAVDSHSALRRNLKELVIEVQGNAFSISGVGTLVSTVAQFEVPMVRLSVSPNFYLLSRAAVSLFTTPIQSISFRTSPEGVSDMRLVDSSGFVRIFLRVEVLHSLMDHFSAITTAVSEVTLVNSVGTISKGIWQKIPSITTLKIVDNLDALRDGRRGQAFPNLTTVRYSPPVAQPSTRDSLVQNLEPFLRSLIGRDAAFDGLAQIFYIGNQSFGAPVRTLRTLETLELHGSVVPGIQEDLQHVVDTVDCNLELLHVPWENVGVDCGLE